MGSSGKLSGADITATPPTGVPVGAQYVDTDFDPPLLMILQSLAPDTWVASAGGGSTQGAPSDAQYLVLAANARLTAEAVHGAVATIPEHHAAFVQADHDALPHPYPMFLGEDGPEGEPGPPGPVGVAGATGATGTAGAQGPVGPPGADGEPGEDTWPGVPGHGVLDHNGFPGGTTTFLRADRSFAAPPAAALPELIKGLRSPTASQTIATGETGMIGKAYEITGTFSLTIAGTGVLMVM